MKRTSSTVIDVSAMLVDRTTCARQKKPRERANYARITREIARGDSWKASESCVGTQRPAHWVVEAEAEKV
eukprot:5509923-Pleurochrysis_carterae.AAC.2